MKWVSWTAFFMSRTRNIFFFFLNWSDVCNGCGTSGFCIFLILVGNRHTALIKLYYMHRRVGAYKSVVFLVAFFFLCFRNTFYSQYSRILLMWKDSLNESLAIFFFCFSFVLSLSIFKRKNIMNYKLNPLASSSSWFLFFCIKHYQ